MSFADLFEITYASQLRRTRQNHTYVQLQNEGYFMIPSEETKLLLAKARRENAEAERDLLIHFMKV